MDPFSIALGAAVGGGVASKFTEIAFDSGKKWIEEYFKNHNAKAQQNANDNTMDFLSELSNRVKELEDSKIISKEKIETAQDHPEFSVFLQKAILTSAQTDNKEKHSILASLVAERLKSEPETIKALSSKIACEAISYATVNQLKILGLAVNILNITPSDYILFSNLKENEIQDWYDQWLIKRVKPFQEITCEQLDLKHLESISCLKVNSYENKISNIFKLKNISYDFEKMKDIALRDSLNDLWGKGLNRVDLTSVGLIIGVSVSNMLTKTGTSLDGWE